MKSSVTGGRSSILVEGEAQFSGPFGPRTSSPARGWRLSYLSLSFAYLVFVSHQPVLIIANSPHDDGLFWTQAASMLSGDWLGPYSQMTMPKGVGFPILIAAGAILSIPVHVVAALVLIGCLSILLVSLRTLGIPELALFGVFVATLSQSSLIMDRPLRDSLYSSLTLVAVALAILVVSPRCRTSSQRLFFVGVVVGVFLITREESIWVAPGLLLVTLGAWIFARRLKIQASLTIRSITYALIGVLVAPTIVSTLNYGYYGTFQTQDFTNGNFPKAIQALQSVTEHPTKRRVPVTLENRQAIYEVSSSFNELRPYFEGPGLGWADHGCRYFEDLCGEYGAGWFSWALRDAVASRGYYSSPSDADAFYGRLSGEVKSACSSGELECKGRGFWLIPQITDAALKELVPTTLKGFGVLTTAQHQGETLGRSSGDPGAVFLIRALLGSPRTSPLPTDDYGLIRGWQLGPNGDEGRFTVICHPDVVQPSVIWKSSSDLVSEFRDEGAGQRRFEFSYPRESECKIILGQGDSQIAVQLNKLGPGSEAESGDFRLHVDSIRQSQVNEPFKFALWVKSGLSILNSFMNAFFLWVCGGGLVLAIISASVRRSRDFGVALVAAGVYALIVSRIILLSIVSVTSFPTSGHLYYMPAFALVSLAGILSIHALIKEVAYWAPRAGITGSLLKSTYNAMRLLMCSRKKPTKSKSGGREAK